VLSAYEFFLAHGNSGGIGTDIEDAGVDGLGNCLPPLPLVGRVADAVDDALDLAFVYLDATDLLQMLGGFLKTTFIASFQAEQSCQGRSVGDLQAEGGIGGIMSALFSGVVVVAAMKRKGSEDARNEQRNLALAHLAVFWNIGRLNAFDGLLEENPHELVGGFENGCSEKHFQIGHALTRGWIGLEIGDQTLNFGFLGEGDFRVVRYFLSPSRRSCRVCSVMIRSYSPTRETNCWWASMCCCTCSSCPAGTYSV